MTENYRYHVKRPPDSASASYSAVATAQLCKEAREQQVVERKIRWFQANPGWRRAVMSGACPHCRSPTGLKQPRTGGEYCEDCGWENGATVDFSGIPIGSSVNLFIWDALGRIVKDLASRTTDRESEQ